MTDPPGYLWLLLRLSYCNFCGSIHKNDLVSPYMKTTLDIPEILFDKAIRHSGAKTKRAAVVLAMEEFVRRAEMKSLADSLGDSETFMESHELMELRSRETPHGAH